MVNQVVDINFDFDNYYIKEVQLKIDNEIARQKQLLSTYKGKYIDKDNYLWTVANLVEICCRRLFETMTVLWKCTAIIGYPIIGLAEYIPALQPLTDTIAVICMVTFVPFVLFSLTAWVCSPCCDSLQEYVDRPKKEYLETVRSQIQELENCSEYILSQEELNLMITRIYNDQKINLNRNVTKVISDPVKVVKHSPGICKMLCEIQPTEVRDIVAYVNRYLNNEPVITQRKNAKS